MTREAASQPTPAELVDGVVCDLDGVVYHGPVAVPGAREALEQLGRSHAVVFATNNASRTPEAVAEHLHSLDVPVRPDRVVTSSTVGAQVLADVVPTGSAVLAVGGEGVSEAIRSVGLTPVQPAECTSTYPPALLQGYGPDVTAADLAVASFAVARGARWVATNTDATLPTDRGPAPGNGALVAAVQTATGRSPETVGKPGPLMYEFAAARVGVSPDRMLGVGDRLETDIAGARAAGMVSAIVLTGVHGPEDLAAAPTEQRPDFVLWDLLDLLGPYEPVEADGAQARCGRARARWIDGELQTQGRGLELLRAALTVVWWCRDAALLDAETAAEVVRSSVGPVESRRAGVENG